jgi:hypothetical protein
MRGSAEYRAACRRYLQFLASEQPIELPVKTIKENYEQPKHYKVRKSNERTNAEAVQAKLG